MTFAETRAIIHPPKRSAAMSEEAERRIRELEEALARERAEKQMYKETVLELLRDTLPSDPPTEEEIHRMLTDRSGTPILEIVAALERGEL